MTANDITNIIMSVGFAGFFICLGVVMIVLVRELFK